MLRNALIAFVLLSVAFSINLVSPQVKNVENGDIIDLGTIGPGQTVSLQIEPLVKTGGIHGIGGQYDQALVTDIPPGWSSTASKLYQNPLQVTISSSPSASEGDYSTKIAVVDEGNGEQLGNVAFTARVHVVHDVLDVGVSPATIKVGPGQPARFAIDITNKGSTSDVFDVSAPGPKRWAFRKQVYVPAQTTKTVYYEIVGNEEETYKTTIKVTSISSGIITEEKNVTLLVESDLFGDYKATNNGVLIFPIFESLPYSLAGLISNLFG